MTAADRMRKARARRRNGVAVLQIEVAIGPLADQLVEAGLLGAWDSEDRDAIKRAVERVLDALIVTDDD